MVHLGAHAAFAASWPFAAQCRFWQSAILCIVHAVAAIVATRNDTELRELFDGSATMDLSFFSNSTASQFLRHFLLKGVLQDAEVLQKRLRRLLGDATFLQAFAHSGAAAPSAIMYPKMAFCADVGCRQPILARPGRSMGC